MSGIDARRNLPHEVGTGDDDVGCNWTPVTPAAKLMPRVLLAVVTSGEHCRIYAIFCSKTPCFGAVPTRSQRWGRAAWIALG